MVICFYTPDVEMEHLEKLNNTNKQIIEEIHKQEMYGKKIDSLNIIIKNNQMIEEIHK